MHVLKWSLVVVLISCGMVRAFDDQVSVAKITDVNGMVTFELMSRSALKSKQNALSDERRLYAYALRMTMGAWQEDSETSGKPFPRSAVSIPSIESVATFMNASDARRRMSELEDREMRARAGRGRVDPALASRAQALYRRQLVQAKIELARQRQAAGLGAEWLEDGALRLVDIEPLATEFGMSENSPPEWNLLKGPGVLDQRMYHGSGQHWPGAYKVIKDLSNVQPLPEGEAYNSAMTNLFAVGGDFMTGVGVWMAAQNSYHWIEFPIPEGAKQFKAELYITDDVHGASFHKHLPMLNIFGLNWTIDGRQVHDSRMTRHGALDGSGEKFDEVTIDIPEGAQVLKVHAENITADNNFNSEVVIHKGRFLF